MVLLKYRCASAGGLAGFIYRARAHKSNISQESYDPSLTAGAYVHWVSGLEILRAVGSPGAGGNSKYQKQGLLVM